MVEVYYRRAFAAGRSALGRVLDYAALRLVLFCAAFLFFRPRTVKLYAALLLAGVALAAAMLLLRFVRESRYARFCEREKRRLRDELLSQRLMLLPEARFTEIIAPLFATGPFCALQCAEKADADALLAFLRRFPQNRPLTVCSTAGFAKSALAFAAQRPDELHLVEERALLDAAGRTELAPTEAEIAAHIRAKESARRERKRSVRLAPFADGGAKKYLAAALVLTLASFLTRYALYYRMLAGFCMLLAGAGLALKRAK